MEKTKKTILITGASGLLGRALLKSLKAKYKVVSLRHKDTDITQEKKVFRIFASVKPWLAIHAAAYTDVDACETNPEKAFAINAKGTRNIAKAAKASGAILIYISTDYVFSGRKKSPYHEHDPALPISIYGKTKLKGEKFITKLLKRHLIIRTSWLFGLGRNTFVDTVIQQAKNSKFLKIVTEKYSTPTYVVDLAEAIKTVIDKINSKNWQDKFYGTYHITNSGFCSWYDYAQYILKVKRIRDVKLSPIRLADIKFKARRPVFSVLDNTKYTSLCARPLRAWQQALKEYIACRHN